MAETAAQKRARELAAQKAAAEAAKIRRNEKIDRRGR